MIVNLQNGTVEEVKKIVNLLNQSEIPPPDVVGWFYYLRLILIVYLTDYHLNKLISCSGEVLYYTLVSYYCYIGF